MSSKVIFFLILFFLESPAFSNDGAAALFGGELVFKQIQGILVVEEDLYIDPNVVKVSYRFLNRTKKTIKTLISFPVEYSTGEDHNFDVEQDNPNNFNVNVDGVEVKFKTKKTRRNEVVTIHQYWEQTFLPEKEIKISHSYKPIFSTSITDYMEVSANDYDQVWGKELKKFFCATPVQVQKMKEKKYIFKSLKYILKTANTWDGPIKHFTLTLGKGRFPHIFLCTDLNLKKVGENFVAKKENFSPKKDLDIAFVGRWK